MDLFLRSRTLSPTVKQRRGLRKGLDVIDHHQLGVEDVAVVHREVRVQRLQQPGRFEVRGGLVQAAESLVRPASLEKRPCVVGRRLRVFFGEVARRSVSPPL